jgi:hypothetical protein
MDIIYAPGINISVERYGLPASPAVEFIPEANLKIAKLKKELLAEVQSKFKHYEPSKASNPGDYPRRISGEAWRSIRVVDANTDDFLGFSIGTDGTTRGGRKIEALSDPLGYAIKPKAGKPLAIPASPKARLASAKGQGPREAFGKDELQLVVTQRGFALLVDKPSWATLKLRKAKNFFSGKKQTIASKQGLIVHYVLWFKPVVVKPRKGIKDALIESLPKIRGDLGGKWNRL